MSALRKLFLRQFVPIHMGNHACGSNVVREDAVRPDRIAVKMVYFPWVRYAPLIGLLHKVGFYSSMYGGRCFVVDGSLPLLKDAVDKFLSRQKVGIGPLVHLAFWVCPLWSRY